jgi:hypothetical protein
VTPAEATLYGAAIAGTFTVLGVVIGAVIEPLLRRMGKVEVLIEEGGWFVQQGAYHPDGAVPSERRLRVAFLNHKDLPVNVRDMSVEFYKGGKPLGGWTRPAVRFVDEHDRVSKLDPVNLPPHVFVPLTLSVQPDREDEVREMFDVDRAVFVATLIGAGDKTRELKPPWREPPPNGHSGGEG